ncbi:metallophosphoesterase [Fusicatenibacter saccharivorans]|uniref:metallophosphoesterase n=1 Tax=Fusicatenibacter saccharivorans TaxID=1150298 RepID=UPI003F8ED695
MKNNFKYNLLKFFQRRKVFLLFGIVVLLIAVGMIKNNFYQSEYSLSSISYEVKADKIQKSIRLVQITDLHNSIFGDNNQNLLDLVAEQAPDLILITGDLLNSDESETDIATNLISGLGSIAPVYVSLGNHEVEYQQNYGIDITQLYEDTGAVVLDRQYQDFEVNGQKVRLGGIYGYYLPEKYLETNEANPEECAFLSDFQNTDLYTILMCHMPVCWMINDGLDEWDVDCVLAGHVHGGQVILPLIGGVYAPDMGWFPGKLQGLYSSEDGSSTMVLSTGLGNTESVPRFNNIPEVVTVDILPK